MSRAKAEVISNISYSADILALQETLPGFQLIDFIGHNKHSVATFVNQNLDQKDIKSIEGNKRTVGIEIGNTNIFNRYKPPSEDWTRLCYH